MFLNEFLMKISSVSSPDSLKKLIQQILDDQVRTIFWTEMLSLMKILQIIIVD